jgi:hypothetical protein
VEPIGRRRRQDTRARPGTRQFSPRGCSDLAFGFRLFARKCRLSATVVLVLACVGSVNSSPSSGRSCSHASATGPPGTGDARHDVAPHGPTTPGAPRDCPTPGNRDRATGDDRESAVRSCPSLRCPRRAQVVVGPRPLGEPPVNGVVLAPRAGAAHHRRLLVVEPHAGGHSSQPREGRDVGLLPGQLVPARPSLAEGSPNAHQVVRLGVALARVWQVALQGGTAGAGTGELRMALGSTLSCERSACPRAAPARRRGRHGSQGVHI